jgi:hypothetical protein
VGVSKRFAIGERKMEVGAMLFVVVFVLAGLHAGGVF